MSLNSCPYQLMKSPSWQGSLLPLEARKIHFCSRPSLLPRPDTDHFTIKGIGRWTFSIHDGDGIDATSNYNLRLDMIDGGHRAQTPIESSIDSFLQSMIDEGSKLHGW